MNNTVSIGRWLLYLVLLAIPVVNIIMLFVLAFGNDNETVRNYGKASLILFAIIFALSIILIIAGAGAGAYMQ